MTLGAGSGRALAIAAFCAGLAAGLRSQVAVADRAVADRAGPGRWRRDPQSPIRNPPINPQSAIRNPQYVVAILAFTGGLLLWFVPLVIVTGGPAAYWRALFNQGAEDFGNIQMLWTQHGRRDVLDALYFAFIAPWALWPVAAGSSSARRSGSASRIGAAALRSSRWRRASVHTHLRPGLSGGLHDPLRAAAGGAPGVSRRRRPACAAVRIRPRRRHRAGDVRRPPRRHLNRRPVARRRRRRSACSTTWARRRGRRRSRPCWPWTVGRTSTSAGRLCGSAIACRRSRASCQRHRSTSGWKR